MTALLVRSTFFATAVLALALPLGLVALRRRPAARHALLVAALVLAALAPLWLSLARPPVVAFQESAGRSVDVPDPVEVTVSAAVAPRRALPLFTLWALGALVFAVRLGRSVQHTRQLRRRARPPGAGERALLPEGPFLIADVPAALVAGVRRPVILLSPSLFHTPEALAQVVAHEQAHLRRRDTRWAALQQLITALYWFHPLVHLAGRAIARAREEACDDQVPAPRPAYARTLLALASPQVLGLGGSALESRIRRLLEGPAPRPSRWWAVALTALVAVAGARFARALAPIAPHPAAAAGRALDPEERRLFAEAGPDVEGAFVIQDLRSSRVVAAGPIGERLTPASTFKVVVALAALESGVLADQHQVLRWDGHPEQIAAWNRDHDLESAMRTSANWFFEEVLHRLPAGTIQRAVTTIGYGNGATGGDPTLFWIEGDLRISALEQAQVMARLASGALPFGRRSQQIVQGVTTLETRGKAVLHGKTGTALQGDRLVSWIVGYVDSDGPSYAYATLIKAPSAARERVLDRRLGITRALLARQGAY